jgi:hypothetical protein
MGNGFRFYTSGAPQLSGTAHWCWMAAHTLTIYRNQDNPSFKKTGLVSCGNSSMEKQGLETRRRG